VSERCDYVILQGRAQLYSVSKKRQGLSTKAEMESQEVAEEIKYICEDNINNCIKTSRR
jgi:hypothetical protein